jgi:acyl-CoA ligase (AMP-forming) (exosortase A-associated)
MSVSSLLHELILVRAAADPESAAIRHGDRTHSYADLAARIECVAAGLVALGMARSDRVAVYLDKRIETVAALFGISAAGGVFVPVNPVLKPAQVVHILTDCGVRILITSSQRLQTLQALLAECRDLVKVVVIADGSAEADTPAAAPARIGWEDLAAVPRRSGHRVIDHDIAAILYTSGSTGRPKGVVLSHRNLVAGAQSVATYLGNRPDDRLLAALPLSFDAGFSQLTTAFHAGACTVLLNYLFPRDVVNAVVCERISGLTAVAPLWIQLAQLDWPASATGHLRYFANTGGRMPRETLARLRQHLPDTRPYLMYGLTEAFRATYLDPDEVDRRPDSIGKAIPNAEVLVLRPDGTPCAPHEPGELVQRGALVAQGYWNQPQATAERFRPLPAALGASHGGRPVPEIAVFSGDTVTRDEEGFLYFVGRNDEMIKTSGYRVSPTEIEEILYTIPSVAECAAFGVPHPQMGEAICAVIAHSPHEPQPQAPAVLTQCRVRMPGYMVPSALQILQAPLPRNPNGKIDRKAIAAQWLRETGPSAP